MSEQPIPEASSNQTPTSRSASRPRNRNSNNRSDVNQSSDSTTFEGACPEIGAVIALRTETIKKREPYAVFTDKLADYVITTMKHGSDVERCIRHLVDPMEGFKEKYEPPPLLDPNPPFNLCFLLEERLKACVKREFEI